MLIRDSNGPRPTKTNASVARTCAHCGARKMRYLITTAGSWCFCESCAKEQTR